MCVGTPHRRFHFSYTVKSKFHTSKIYQFKLYSHFFFFLFLVMLHFNMYWHYSWSIKKRWVMSWNYGIILYVTAQGLTTVDWKIKQNRTGKGNGKEGISKRWRRMITVTSDYILEKTYYISFNFYVISYVHYGNIYFHSISLTGWLSLKKNH